MGLKLPSSADAYLALVKLGIIGVILAATFIGGCNHGMDKGEAQRTADRNELQAKIDKRNEGLRIASDALNDAAATFKKVNALALEAIARDKASKEAAARAGAADKAAAERMARQIAGFDKKLEHARKNPDCDVLLSTDVEAKCAIP